jgi:hypothetical protein
VAGFLDKCNKLSGSIKGGEFFEYLKVLLASQEGLFMALVVWLVG